MSKEAQYDLLVITDSDVRVQPSFLREVISPLAANSQIGGTTCVYRGMAKGLGLWGLMEGLGMSVEMTAGVIVAEMLEGMKFMLGPTMIVRKEALNKIGGFDSLGYYYADDFMLGNLVSNSHTVTLSTHTIDHCIVNDSFVLNFKHQWSWAKSTRFSRPLGHFGTVLTYSTPFGLLGLLGAYVAGLPSFVGFALLAWAYLSRVLLCLIAGGMVVHDSDAYKFCWLYPLRDLLGFVFWAASYTSRHVGWRDDLFILEKKGKMRKVNA
jgi:ceramide glucosyltransferase